MFIIEMEMKTRNLGK